MRQITFSPYNKTLTNCNVWTQDGNRIVFDVRSDREGSAFDGTRIESINVETGETEVLYRSFNGACCGVATCSQADDRIVCIHGPENPTADWHYGPTRRWGTILHSNGKTETLDGCQLASPFVPGSLRGGSHVHVFSGDGTWISFTYQDELLRWWDENRPLEPHDPDQRNVGVSVPITPAPICLHHPRNHTGTHFSVLVSRTVAKPQPGSDEIEKAYEDAWVGTNGYVKPNGKCQKKAIAFLGDLVSSNGKKFTEVFLVDLPDDPAEMQREGDGPLAGTETRRPLPPKNVTQKRLTFTETRKFPGIQGPRHWVRSSPDGSQIAFLFRGDHGIVQLGSVSPNGGEITAITNNPWSVESAFTWSPDGRSIAYVMNRSVFLTTGIGETKQRTIRLTPQAKNADDTPLPLAVVFSPDGQRIAFQKNVLHENGKRYNQIFYTAGG